jgi:hypothetical protein
MLSWVVVAAESGLPLETAVSDELDVDAAAEEPVRIGIARWSFRDFLPVAELSL